MSRASTSDMAERLRSMANEHPTVATLKSRLPAMPDEELPAEGLYVDAQRTPGLVVNGELRVSVVRVISVGPDGSQLIGQIQATREVDHPLASWSLKLYTHDPKHFQTDRVDERQGWFVQMLELHYRTTEAEPELEVGVEA